jgi:hypothetical protein
MEKIKISSIESLKEAFNSFGLNAAAEAKKILQVPTELVAESLLNSVNDDAKKLTIIKLQGFTVKFDTVLLTKIIMSKEIEISLFEAVNSKNETIKWSRITAAV